MHQDPSQMLNIAVLSLMQALGDVGSRMAAQQQALAQAHARKQRADAPRTPAAQTSSAPQSGESAPQQATSGAPEPASSATGSPETDRLRAEVDELRQQQAQMMELMRQQSNLINTLVSNTNHLRVVKGG